LPSPGEGLVHKIIIFCFQIRDALFKTFSYDKYVKGSGSREPLLLRPRTSFLYLSSFQIPKGENPLSQDGGFFCKDAVFIKSKVGKIVQKSP
jgi:hypothetical protein